ncbi:MULTISPECIES: hypothetical protein [unclassified Streptomyces]|uniref:hypothetical protein n=1 Tax=unclassified Streptomyces TaxID=2593676 RepID=UPI0036687B49
MSVKADQAHSGVVTVAPDVEPSACSSTLLMVTEEYAGWAHDDPAGIIRSF